MQKTSFPGNMYKDAELFENLWHYFPSKQFDKHYRRFYSIILEALLALDISAKKITVRKAIISHPDTRLGLYGFRALGKGRRWSTLCISGLCRPDERAVHVMERD